MSSLPPQPQLTSGQPADHTPRYGTGTCYFGHSSSFDFRSLWYAPLKNLSDVYGGVFPHENSDEQFSSREYFQSGRCKVFVAEVSHHSTGLGIELGWADICGVPLICCVQRDARLPGSIATLNAEVIVYEDVHDLVVKIGSRLERLLGDKNIEPTATSTEEYVPRTP